MFKTLRILFVTSCIYFVINSNVISDKFEDDNTLYSIRKNDFVGSIRKIMENQTKRRWICIRKFINEQNVRNIKKNSNGLLIFLIQFGVVYGILYILLLYAE